VGIVRLDEQPRGFGARPCWRLGGLFGELERLLDSYGCVTCLNRCLRLSFSIHSRTLRRLLCLLCSLLLPLRLCALPSRLYREADGDDGHERDGGEQPARSLFRALRVISTRLLRPLGPLCFIGTRSLGSCALLLCDGALLRGVGQLRTLHQHLLLGLVLLTSQPFGLGADALPSERAL